VVEASEKDVESQVQENLSQHNLEAAKDVVEANGGEMTTNVDPIDTPSSNTSSSGGNISANSYWQAPKDGKSNLYMCISDGDWIDGDYRVYGGWTLYEDDVLIENTNTCPSDAAALLWHENYFVPAKVGVDNFYNNGNSRVSFSGTKPNGILANVDDPNKFYNGTEDSWGGLFGANLNVVQDGAEDHPIIFQYTHTYIDATEDICGLDLSFSIGPASINLNGDPEGWTDATQKNNLTKSTLLISQDRS
jgi:hypothetical protein